MLRIGVLLSHFPIGNVSCVELLRRFAKRETLKVISIMSSGYPSINDLEKHVVTILSFLKSRGRRYATLALGPIAVSFLRSFDPEVYWIIDTSFPFFVFRLMRGAPKVLLLDDPDFSKPPKPIITDRHLRKIVVTTSIVKKKLLKWWMIEEERVEVIPLGVDLTKFRPAPLSDEPIVLYYGTLVPLRGRLLVKVIEETIKQYAKAKFMIIGDIPKWFLDILCMKDLIKHVELPGYIPHDQLPSWISKSRVCILPQSRSLGGRFSQKLIEYMACGRPIVTTDVEESFLVREADAGIVTPINARKMAEAIVYLLRDERSAIRYAKNGVAFAEKYDWDEIANRHLKLFKEVAYKSD